MRAPKLTKIERRKAIVDAAAQLFSERGFRGVTTRELAQSVGVTEPVLYEHFQTKRDLYAAIIDGASRDSFEQARETLRQSALADEPAAFFTTLATLMVENVGRNPSYLRLVLFSALEKHELAQLCFERHAQSIYSIVIEYLKKRMTSGAIRRIDPVIAARLFIGAIHHYCIFELHFGFRIVRASKKRAIATMVDTFLHGIHAS